MIQGAAEEIAEGVDVDFVADKWGKKWASAEYKMPVVNYDESEADEAVDLMVTLIERTKGYLDRIIEIE